MRRSLVLAVAIAAFAGIAHAQPYPNRPIKFVAPFPPGGSSDVLCRLLGAKLAEGLGQPVTIENRPGAAAAIGHEYAAKQPPDGYTIVITSSSTLVNNLYLYKHQAFDVFTDFAPISMIASAGQVLVVHPSVPAKSVRELIALAKAQPGKLNFGSGGKGIQSHISGEMFKAATGVDIIHVPYKGTVQSVSDLVAGQVQMVFSDMVPALPHIRAGRLRPLAVTTRERAAVLPDVPTMIEAGVPGYDSAGGGGARAKGTARGDPRPPEPRVRSHREAARRAREVREPRRLPRAQHARLCVRAGESGGAAHGGPAQGGRHRAGIARYPFPH